MSFKKNSNDQNNDSKHANAYRSKAKVYERKLKLNFRHFKTFTAEPTSMDKRNEKRTEIIFNNFKRTQSSARSDLSGASVIYVHPSKRFDYDQ
jgi:hypothetical protein